TGFTTDELASKFVEGWKNLPPHRKNMLNPDVTETGAAVARSAETGYYYAVQMFGRPKSLAFEFEIANRAGAEVTYKVGDESFTLKPRYVMKHTVCVPTDVTFQWPDAAGEAGKGGSQTIRPTANGERYAVVTGPDGKLTVRKE